MSEVMIEATINGTARTFACDTRDSLLEVLRDRLGLRGAKAGCNTGDCGACTVRLDGDLVCACLVLAVEIEGRAVQTVEGLGTDGALHRVQAAFVAEDALQCGVCTPGFVVAAVDLLERNPHPTETEVRQALEGNLCRCTGYDKIVRAVLTCAGARDE